MENILPRREARENAFLLAFSQTFGDVPLAEALTNHAENDEEHPVDGFSKLLLNAYYDHSAEVDDEIRAHLRNWTMERLPRVSLTVLMGPDTGYDMINTATCGGQIAALLSALNDTDECPKTIIYSLNPADNEQIGTILGCFQSSEVPGKIQHGSAWWFNDQKIGMENQMKSLANLGLLGNFVGMLTDSRSFLSYTRHDYFRRILCNLIGQWVEDGEYPNDEKALEKIVKGICFDNAKRYFAL